RRNASSAIERWSNWTRWARFCRRAGVPRTACQVATMSASRIELDTITPGRVVKPYRARAFVSTPAAIDVPTHLRGDGPGQRVRCGNNQRTTRGGAAGSRAKSRHQTKSPGRRRPGLRVRRCEQDYGRIMPFAEPFHVAEVPSVAVPVRLKTHFTPR